MQTLSLGSLDYNSLQWQEVSWYGKTFLRAVIPRSRLHDFVTGEGERGETKFIKFRTEPHTQQGKKQTVLSKITYHCTYGPEDKSNNLLQAPGLKVGEVVVDEQHGTASSQPEGGKAQLEVGGNREEAAKPRRKPTVHTEQWQSVKRGCGARFHAVVYKEKPEEVEIRYHQQQHVNAAGAPCHGKACPGADRKRKAPKPTAAARAFSRVAELQQAMERLRGQIEEGDPIWQLVETGVGKCTEMLLKKEAVAPSRGNMGITGPPLGIDLNASEGGSLARQKSPLERGWRNKKGRAEGKQSMAVQSPEQPAADKAVPSPAARK